MENNITRAAGPGGQESTGTYLLTHTGAEVDAAIEGWQTAQAQADATASDIAEGKKAITKDGLVTGTMEESGGNCDLTDPMSVYKATRPGDWLPMPEPDAGEAYMLYLVPPTDQALFAVQVVFSGSATIQLGDTEPISLVSDVAFETEFDWNACENLTKDGFKQVLIKISGNNITNLSFATHSLKSNSRYKEYPVLDFSGNLPEATSVKMANKRTKYFSLSKSSIIDMSNMFSSCYDLIAITKLDTSQVTSMANMFSSCYTLIAIPRLNTSQVTSMASMFSACYSIKRIPEMDTSKVVSMDNMLSNCRSLEYVPYMDTSKVTTMGKIFYYCHSVSQILRLNISSAKSISTPFSNCDSLSKLTFANEGSITRTTTINLGSLVLSRNAILDLFDSLPIVNNVTAKLTLTGNPGVPDLTDEDKAIATRKGWTLTL